MPDDEGAGGGGVAVADAPPPATETTQQPEETQDDLIKQFAPGNIDKLLAEQEAAHSGTNGTGNTAATPTDADQDRATQEAAEAQALADKTAAAAGATQDGTGNLADTPDAIAQINEKYKTKDELARAHANLQSLYGKQSQELGDARKSSTQPAPGTGSNDAATPPNTGQSQTAEKPEPEPEKLGQYGYDPNGFPKDKYGISVLYDDWWNEQRLKEWADACGGDVEEATRRRNQEQAVWTARYEAQRGIAEQSARTQAEQEQIKKDNAQAAVLMKQQEEEIPKVVERLTLSFSKVLPEAGAKAATEEVINLAGGILKEALDAGRVTVLQASDPKMVRESVGEAMRRLVIDDKLEDLFTRHAATTGADKKTDTATALPPMLEGGSGAGAGAGAGAAPRSVPVSKVRQSDITDNDRKMAAGFTKAGSPTTPEEVAAERLSQGL